MQACRLAVEQHRDFELRVPCYGSGRGLPGQYSSQPSSARSSVELLAAGGGAGAAAGPAASGSQLPGSGSVAEGCPGQPQGGGPVRWVRMQFRSTSGPSALKMAPSISIPPMLVQPTTADGSATGGHAYYWATIDPPSPHHHHHHQHGAGALAPLGSSCNGLEEGAVGVWGDRLGSHYSSSAMSVMSAASSSLAPSGGGPLQVGAPPGGLGG